MEAGDVLRKLGSMGSQRNVEGMARYGINPEGNLGASVTDIRALAKGIGTDHALALELWRTGIRDARFVAALVADPEKVDRGLAESWVMDLNSWDLCDHACGNLFDRLPYVYELVREWTARDEEFVKRAGFVLLAWLAVHQKGEDDSVFQAYLPVLEEGARDERRYVWKGVDWALRQIGKCRGRKLHGECVKLARKLKRSRIRSQRWVGARSLKELESEKVKARVARTEEKRRKKRARRGGRGPQ